MKHYCCGSCTARWLYLGLQPARQVTNILQCYALSLLAAAQGLGTARIRVRNLGSILREDRVVQRRHCRWFEWHFSNRRNQIFSLPRCSSRLCALSGTSRSIRAPAKDFCVLVVSPPPPPPPVDHLLLSRCRGRSRSVSRTEPLHTFGPILSPTLELRPCARPGYEHKHVYLCPRLD